MNSGRNSTSSEGDDTPQGTAKSIEGRKEQASQGQPTEGQAPTENRTIGHTRGTSKKKEGIEKQKERASQGQRVQEQASTESRTFGLSVSDVLSLAAIIIAVATLFLSQFYRSSNLAIIITELDPVQSPLQQEADGLHFKTQTRIGLQIINSANSPSVLIRAFWVTPDDLEYDCPSVASRVEWNVYSSEAYHDNQVRYEAFVIDPQTIPPYSVVSIKASTRERDAVRPTRDIGKPRQSCLAFVSTDYSGDIYVVAIPAMKIEVGGNTFAYTRNREVMGVVTLIESEFHLGL